MSIAEFVSHLRNLDVRLSAEGQRLHLNAPKGVLTDSLRAQIAERKQELLQFLSNHDQPAAFIPPAILRRAAGSPAPLSFAQGRLWFLEQLESGSAVYNICRAFRLTGQLNIAALESSLSEILRRHEILRSQICIVDGLPVQITVAVSRFELPVTDLRSSTETEREQEVRDRIKAEAEWQFDFSAGSFLRAVLLQISNDQHILILTTHHIVADAWSMGILTRELWTLYDALANERTSPLQELAVQYADYAVWQREWLQGDVVESQLSYWKEELKELPILNLPTDHPRPVKQSFRGARQPLSLPESLTAAINELSRGEGVTQFMTLLAAFQVLLYRYSGQEDVVVGSPIANRNRTETEELIGFFVNTFVLRAGLSEKPTFKELLRRVRDVCLQAYDHQDLPFEKLVEELRPERDLSRNPLFQVMFVLQNTPRPFPQPSGLSIERVDVPTATSLFDLSLYLRERDGKLIGFFEYNTDLFEPSTIERMIGHFETLLEGIVADPEQPISTLPLLTEAERHQLLVEWNDTTADYPKDSCIHELFEAQVERTPEAIAVQFEGKQLTYGELNSQANKLAHHLQGFGVGPEKLVGISVNPSLEMVIGLLGILKAGGAYVPLDPMYPKERIEFMMEDSGIDVLLTQGDLVENLNVKKQRGIILDDSALWNHQTDTNPRSGAEPDSPAYVIYTSGSTGVPKGVVGLHRGAVNRFSWMWKTFPFETYDRSCIKTSLSFVDSVWEVFGSLLQGIPTIIIPQPVTKNPEQLVHMLGAARVTRVVFVPALLKPLLEQVSDLKTRLPDLKICSSSGEYLPMKLARQFRTLLPHSILLNLYGSSEVSADVTCHKVGDAVSQSDDVIGRPIDNTRIYILDSNLEPVPIGIRGELYVGGAALAREYLNQPKLTAEKFVFGSFTDETWTKLFRTGDLARYRSDGNIEFLGRVDNQVKIRGYRIEQGEIEAVLNQHPLVSQSVVVACQCKSSSETCILAYVLLAKPSALTTAELRDFLRLKVPEYMVPSVIVILDTLPLMSNGKIDISKLAQAGNDTIRLNQELVEPRTELEELIAQIWKSVLNLERISIYDNFFEIGGHSLLATQIVARLRVATNTVVPFQALFECPTVAAMAQYLKRAARHETQINLPPIVRVKDQQKFPLSVSQQQLWALDKLVPTASFFNIPYAYRLTGSLNQEVLENVLVEILKRHQALRTVFTEIDGFLYQTVGPTPSSILESADLTKLGSDDLDAEIARLVGEEASLPFNLTTGCLFRSKLYGLAHDQNILLIVMHHIISDRWSMNIFFNELVILYRAFCEGRPSPLPDLPTQLGDFAVWQNNVLEKGFLDGQIEYWKKQLVGPISRIKFAQEIDETNQLSFQTSRQPLELAAELVNGIKRFAREEHCTTFMVAHAAFAILIHQCTRQRDIRIGAMVANRAQQEAEDVIGHYVNTVILRTRLVSDFTFRDFLKCVRETVLEACSNQELPFETLTRILENQHRIDCTALMPALINYHRFTSEVHNVCGLSFAPLGWQQPAGLEQLMFTTFDLVLNLSETSTMLTGSVTLKTETFGPVMMSELINRFQDILATMIQEPNHKITQHFK